MSDSTNTVTSPSRTVEVTLPNGKGTRTTKRKYAPRKSPLASAIASCEDSLAQTEGKKALYAIRIETMQAKLAEISANAGQFDALIATLHKNLESLHMAESALIEAGIRD